MFVPPPIVLNPQISGVRRDNGGRRVGAYRPAYSAGLARARPPQRCNLLRMRLHRGHADSRQCRVAGRAGLTIDSAVSSCDGCFSHGRDFLAHKIQSFREQVWSPHGPKNKPIAQLQDRQLLSEGPALQIPPIVC